MPLHLSLPPEMISRLCHTSYRIMRATTELYLQIRENFLEISLKISMSHVAFYVSSASVQSGPPGKHYLFANDNFQKLLFGSYNIFLLSHANFYVLRFKFNTGVVSKTYASSGAVTGSNIGRDIKVQCVLEFAYDTMMLGLFDIIVKFYLVLREMHRLERLQFLK